MASGSPVHELVQIPLATTFSTFLSIFKSELLPLLSAEEGLISIYTGEVVRATEPLSGAWAVSLTEWRSFEAHKQFLERATTKHFFETLEKLARGPPDIHHYNFGNLDGVVGFGWTRFSVEKLNKKTTSDLKAVVAESMEESNKWCAVESTNERDKIERRNANCGESGNDGKIMFDVNWQHHFEKKARSRL